MPDLTEKVDLSTYILDFGKKHRGERIQRVPASYLLWQVNERAGPWKIAQLELDRRSIKLPTVEVSHHAIDSASLRIRRTWHETREKEEGLYTWLARMTEEAIEKGERGEEGEIVYLGVKWVITEAGRWPTLKTVIPVKGRG